jgi:hypothetical protein
MKTQIVKTQFLLAMMGLLVLTYLLVVWPIVRKVRLQRRYPIGTPIEKVLKHLQVPYTLVTNGPVFPYGEPTEQQKQLYAFFDVTIPDENVRLEFNYYRNVVGVLVINHPLTASWKKLTSQ